MKRLVSILSLIIFGLINNLSAQDILTGQYLLKLEEGVDGKTVVDGLKIRMPIPKDSEPQPPIGADVKVELDKYTGIWFVEFPIGKEDQADVLNQLRNTPGVLYAQYNRTVTERDVLEPNDPSYPLLWHFDDPQDNDIDAPEAWFKTTGGTTPNGDRIVVAVLEGGGADWAHPDLIDNHWTNSSETPNNGFDDDGNGYIDDYHGWNVSTNSDNISGGTHGTGVSGMIGATGNNNYLYTGVNWDVEIMQIQMAGLSEANVIAAYSYALNMRELYNTSGGTEGAFVVATNASWGIDYGNPDQYPIWCEFYDTMGEAGIINVAATINSYVNVDNVGDMPTGCSSQYLVGVTATNNNDFITYGYGSNSIDLGAPGYQIYTTGYSGTIQGTSFASPLVAGSIALMYSADCGDLSTLALSDPQAAADIVLNSLYASVDPITSMADKTASGGRLNVNNAIDSLLVGCGEVYGCTDVLACNYNASATFDYGCDYESCVGCLDESACNYDASYTTADNTQCYYPAPGFTCTDSGTLNLDLVTLSGSQSESFEFQMAGYLESIAVSFAYTETNSSSYPSDFTIYLQSPNGNCVEFGGWNLAPICDNYSNIGAWTETSGGNGTYSFSKSLGEPIGGPGTWTVTIRNGWTGSSSVTYDADVTLNYVNINQVGVGCTDPTACNYDPTATSNFGCEYAEQYYDCEGVCQSDVDEDGVCDELEVSGCDKPTACNYNPDATDSDGSCVYAQQYYDCDGNCIADFDGDGVCDEFETSGCTDTTACNYIANATDDDGSCVYAEEFYDCDDNCLNDTDDDGICDELETVGCTDETACNYANYSDTDNTLCTYPAEDYLDCDGNCLNDTDSDGVCDENEIFGCTIPTACNYDQTATQEDNTTCTFAVEYYDCDGNCLNDTNGNGVCDELEPNGLGPCGGLSLVGYGIIGSTAYNLAPIGEQCWFDRDLETVIYRNGDTIPMITDPSEWNGLNTGAYTIYNNGAPKCNSWEIAEGSQCCTRDTVYLDGDVTWTLSNASFLNYPDNEMRVYPTGGFNEMGKLNVGFQYDTTSTKTFWASRLDTIGLWDQNVYYPAEQVTDYYGRYPGGICQEMTLNITDNTQEYFMGIAADNYAIVTLNGDTILHQNEGVTEPSGVVNPDPYNYKYWHVYPISLDNGDNVFTVTVINQNLYGSVGFEIYQNTYVELAEANSSADLNIVLDMSDLLGQSTFGDECTALEEQCTNPGQTYDQELVACIFEECEVNNYYATRYGNLYNWYAVTDPRGLCPSGFHVATDRDWIELESYLGMPEIDLQKIQVRGETASVADSLKQTYQFWPPFNQRPIPYLFEAMPGGIRVATGEFGWESERAYWWTSTGFKTRNFSQRNNAWFRSIDKGNKGINRNWNISQIRNGYNHGMYVRCIKD